MKLKEAIAVALGVAEGAMIPCEKEFAGAKCHNCTKKRMAIKMVADALRTTRREKRAMWKAIWGHCKFRYTASMSGKRSCSSGDSSSYRCQLRACPLLKGGG